MCRKLVSLALLLIFLVGCTVSSVDVEQEQASGLAGELLDGHTWGQTFTPNYDGLYRIDLYTATYARQNTHPVLFRIKAAPDVVEDLVRLEVPAAQISNSGPTVLTFPPLAETAGRTLYFSVESPGSVPGDAITVYRHTDDVYPGGQMFLDGQLTTEDMAFIAHTQQAFTLGDIWHDFYSRASQDRPFFLVYCSLLALLLVMLSLSLAWSHRRKPAEQVPPAQGEEQGADDEPAASTQPATEVRE
jgi:hypothetical protein